MNSRAKISYNCNACGASFPKWAGRCADCGEWNSLQETMRERTAGRKLQGYAGEALRSVRLSDVRIGEQARFSSGIGELDRVLGGGLVAGGVVLLGGDPGIGKSTILLQTLSQLSVHRPCLYVTGEESLEQVALRSARLGMPADELQLMAATCVESIVATAEQDRPQVMVIDSVQTIYTESLGSAPGGVAQVRECSAQLVRLAKRLGISVFLVGHVTKEGTLAGPRVLEHMVDTVLYFEGQQHDRYRMLRAVKNRFGAVNELGVFAMSEDGLREVKNPSAIFLSRGQAAVAGSSVMVTWEGTRPMLIEVQALVDSSSLGNPRRVSVGLDQNRLGMLLAVLHRHGGVTCGDQDVFANVVGGVRVMETASDLPLLLAIMSSLRDRSLPQDLVAYGELGLSGEVRPVPCGVERLAEAVKHGFRKALVPRANLPRRAPAGMQVHGVDSLQQALDVLAEL